MKPEDETAPDTEDLNERSSTEDLIEYMLRQSGWEKPPKPITTGFRTSNDLADLAKALADAQGKLEDPVADSRNPLYSSNYADLAGYLSKIRPVFSAAGLSLIQATGRRGKLVVVTTRVLHESGQWMEFELECEPLEKKANADGGGYKENLSPQGIGKAITYLRRYSAAAASGLAQEDPDGNADQSNDQAPRPRPQASNRGPQQESTTTRTPAAAQESVTMDPAECATYEIKSGKYKGETSESLVKLSRKAARQLVGQSKDPKLQEALAFILSATRIENEVIPSLLKGITNLGQLQKFWTTLDPDQQTEFGTVKDAIKGILVESDNGGTADQASTMPNDDNIPM